MDNCDQADAIGYGTQLILDDKIDTIIGPACLSCAFQALSLVIRICSFQPRLSPDFSPPTIPCPSTFGEQLFPQVFSRVISNLRYFL
jgi:hypothetical protein